MWHKQFISWTQNTHNRSHSLPELCIIFADFCNMFVCVCVWSGVRFGNRSGHTFVVVFAMVRGNTEMLHSNYHAPQPQLTTVCTTAERRWYTSKFWLAGVNRANKWLGLYFCVPIPMFAIWTQQVHTIPYIILIRGWNCLKCKSNTSKFMRVLHDIWRVIFYVAIDSRYRVGRGYHIILYKLCSHRTKLQCHTIYSKPI